MENQEILIQLKQINNRLDALTQDVKTLTQDFKTLTQDVEILKSEQSEIKKGQSQIMSILNTLSASNAALVLQIDKLQNRVNSSLFEG